MEKKQPTFRFESKEFEQAKEKIKKECNKITAGNTMPNTEKSEAIRKAYGEYWEQVKDYVDQYGRLTYQQCWDIWDGDTDESNFYSNVLRDKTIDLQDDYEGYYQPKSLQGIDDNRGWIKIESAKDFPEPGQYWVIDDDGDMFITDMEFFEDMFDWTAIRYYQPIVKPEKPIY